MNRGVCSGCGNMSEVHRGDSGKWYCEDCLGSRQPSPPREGRSPLRSEPRASEGHSGSNNAGPLSSKRDEYLEYIICHVTDEWIDDFLDELKREWKRSYGWVNELRKIDDNMKLLRLAAELGYGKHAKHKTSLNYDVIADVGKLDGVIEGEAEYQLEEKGGTETKPRSGKKGGKKGKTSEGTGGAKKKKKR